MLDDDRQRPGVDHLGQPVRPRAVTLDAEGERRITHQFAVVEIVVIIVDLPVRHRHRRRNHHHHHIVIKRPRHMPRPGPHHV